MKQIKLVPVCFKQGDVIPHRPIKAAKAGLSLYALNREVNTCIVLRKGENLKGKGVAEDEDKKGSKN